MKKVTGAKFQKRIQKKQAFRDFRLETALNCSFQFRNSKKKNNFFSMAFGQLQKKKTILSILKKQQPPNFQSSKTKTTSDYLAPLQPQRPYHLDPRLSSV